MLTRHPIDWILTSDPAALGLALSAITASTVACLLLALFWLLRPPRRVVAPRCAKCRYLLADPAPARCSECGADLARADAVQRHGRGARWRPALMALGCAGACLGAQWSTGAGWMPFGATAALAVEAWQRTRTDPVLDLIAPEVFVARAIEEVAPPGAVCIRPRFLSPRNFASKARLAALRDAVLDPATSVKAFAAAREIILDDALDTVLAEAERSALRGMLVDAVILDPTLVGAAPAADGALEVPAFAPGSSVAAHRFERRASDGSAVDLDQEFALDIPCAGAFVGVGSELVRVEGVMTHADGRRASRAIRLDSPVPQDGTLRTARIWFVPAPTPDPANWSVSVEGEIRHRFVSETLRDDAGAPRARIMVQRFRATIDRVEVRPSVP